MIKDKAANSRPNQKHEASRHALWGLFEALRGAEAVNELLDPVLTLAVIASQCPEDFLAFYKSPKAKQVELLATLINGNKQLAELDAHSPRSVLALSPDSLQQIIYRLYEVDDWASFATQAIAIDDEFQGKRAGESITASSVASLVAALAGDLSQQKVYDGAAGLCESVQQLDAATLQLEEINTTAWSRGKKLLLIRGKQASYTLGDSIFDLQPPAKADWVITQPPWAVRFPSGRAQQLVEAPFLQFGQGERIPTSAGDALWVQHALYHTHKTGKVIILLPQGVLFRGGYDAKLRDHLLEHDLVDTVISLPAGLFRHTAIPAVVLILNKAKPEQRQGEVRFVDASELGKTVGRQTQLTPEKQSLIVSLANGEQAEHPAYKAVLLPDIYQNDNILNVRHHIQQTDKLELPTLEEEKHNLQTALATQQQAQTSLLTLLGVNVGGQR